jgi:hypothetical protein
MRGKEAWKKMTKRLEVQRAPAPLEEYAKHFEKLFGREQEAAKGFGALWKVSYCPASDTRP